MSMKALTKSKAISTAIERLPETVDIRPLLDENTQTVVARKEKLLSDVAQAEDVLLRRIAKLEAEIRQAAGAKMEQLKESRKILVQVKKRRAEVGQSICTTIEDALEFVPGADIMAKKQHLLAQRSKEAA